MSDVHVFTKLAYPDDGSVIHDLDLSLGHNEKLALFGPNGAGKTSILRAIAGAVNGRTRRSDVAYLPQKPFMFRGTVRHNLTLARQEEAAVALASDLGVGHMLDHDARTLSGGMAQRVAIARALCGDEAVVLLDEPLAPIDAADRSVVVDVIREQTSGRASIAVTHSVDAAATLAETLAIVDAGRILQRGPVAQVLGHPASQRVSEIVGEGNVLAGTITSSVGAVARVDIGSAVIAVVTDMPTGAHVLLRIGEETITVFDAPPSGASNRNVIEATIAEIAPKGTLIEITVAEPVPLRAVITPGAFDDMAIEPGAKVWFGIKASAIGVVATP